MSKVQITPTRTNAVKPTRIHWSGGPVFPDHFGSRLWSATWCGASISLCHESIRPAL